MEIISLVIVLFIVFFSVVVHEFCHGYMAYLNGDNTAMMMGRLTLNPLPHIDPFGTILLPILLLLISRGHFAIGMAKPVPINPFNFRNYDRGLLAVGIAGPGSNIILGTFLALISRLFPNALVSQFLIIGAVINFILALFNLIPIPPLDGSRILSVFLPGRIRHRYEQMERYGIIIVMAFIFLGGLGWLGPLSIAIVNFITGTTINL
ncbi:MAG: site-2 protease family protein [Candidatus Ratteibacteria bacterium]|nr:site-2 protease family protein [Candidatus Ratteibacteria bacterium]